MRVGDDDSEQFGERRVSPDADSMTNDTGSTLADGTRGDVPNAPKGIRIATRCVTIEQFVETYHQVCEDTAIFIPNTQRSSDTVLQFRFNLHDGSPALLGIGTVVEELTTKHNRFNHVGIVVELQRLSRTSEITFEKMLAARAQTKLEAAAPAPVYPRAMTVPIEVIDATKLQRMTESHHVPPRQVPIPPPVALPPVNVPRIPTTRTKTALGLPAVVMPVVAKKAMDTVRIPAIIAPPAQKPIITPPAQKPAIVQPPAPEQASNQPTRDVQCTIVETPSSKEARTPAEQPARDALATARPTLESTCVPDSIDDGWDSIAIKVVDVPLVPVALAVVPVTAKPAERVATTPVATMPVATTEAMGFVSVPVSTATAMPAAVVAMPIDSVTAEQVATIPEAVAVSAKPVATAMPTSMPVATAPAMPIDSVTAKQVATIPEAVAVSAKPVATVTPTSMPVATVTAMPIDSVTAKQVATVPEAVSAKPVATMVTTVATVVELAIASTTTDDVEDSLDVSDASMTEVDDDLALASAEIERDLLVPFDDQASVSAVTVVARRGACSTEPDPFETVTSVESPDGFLLALMRRDDGRAAPAVREAAPVPFAPSPFAASPSPFAGSPYAPSPLAPSPFASSPGASSDAPVDAPFAMHALDPAALAAAPVGTTRRSWRWVAGAGVFGLLLCATVATSMFIRRPVAAVAPSTTFAPAHEDSAAVATARDQAPPVAVAPKKPPVHANAAPPAPPIVKINPRARPSTVERPSPRPRPAARPLRQPAPKKCKNLGCL